MLLRWFEHSQIYHPSRVLMATGAELGRPFEDVFFRTSEGLELNGWFFPADTESSRSSLVVLFCHGNAGNISHRLDMVQALLAPGANVFVYDYRGYGRSQGYPSEEGTYQDSRAAYQWLQKKGFSGEQILLFGESLGGAVATDLATQVATCGLVLENTFTRITDIGADLYPWLPVRWLAQIKYDTLSKLPRVHVPVLVMHSREDRLIRFHHSQRNFAAANEPKLFWELEGGHNDPLTNRPQFISGLEKFFGLFHTSQKQAGKAQV